VWIGPAAQAPAGYREGGIDASAERIQRDHDVIMAANRSLVDGDVYSGVTSSSPQTSM
jgi:hypothetical protein